MLDKLKLSSNILATMSEAHDRIIADKEYKIEQLDKLRKISEEALQSTQESLRKVSETLKTEGASLKIGADTMDVTIEVCQCIAKATTLVNDYSVRLLSVMRDTKAAVVVECNQLKGAVEDVKQLRFGALSELQKTLQVIESIKPSIVELTSDTKYLELIKVILNACSPALHRERPNTNPSESPGPTLDVPF